jgi:branched-chain amino acid transport system substrate-binding protein
MRKNIKYKKGLIIGLVAVVVAVGAEAVKSAPAVALPATEIVVSYAGDRTGPNAVNMIMSADVWADYWKRLNTERGGIVVGGKTYKIRNMWADSEALPKRQVELYKRFAEAGSVAHGAGSTSESESLIEMAARYKVPVMGQGGGKSMTEAKGWVLPIIGNYAVRFATALKHFKTQWKETRPPRLAFLIVDLPAGWTIVEPDVLQYLKEGLGYDIVAKEAIPMVILDATPQLLKIKSTNPDVIAFMHWSAGVVVVAKDARRIGLDVPKVNWITIDLALYPPVFEMAGDVSIFDGWLAPCGLYGKEREGNQPEVKRFYETIGKLYPQRAYINYLAIAGEAWISARLTQEAIERVIKAGLLPVTGEKVYAELKKMTGFQTGICPPIEFTETIREPYAKHRIYMAKKGQLYAVSDYISIETEVKKWLPWVLGK